MHIKKLIAPIIIAVLFVLYLTGLLVLWTNFYSIEMCSTVHISKGGVLL